MVQTIRQLRDSRGVTLESFSKKTGISIEECAAIDQKTIYQLKVDVADRVRAALNLESHHGRAFNADDTMGLLFEMEAIQKNDWPHIMSWQFEEGISTQEREERQKIILKLEKVFKYLHQLSIAIAAEEITYAELAQMDEFRRAHAVFENYLHHGLLSKFLETRQSYTETDSEVTLQNSDLLPPATFEAQWYLPEEVIESSRALAGALRGIVLQNPMLAQEEARFDPLFNLLENERTVAKLFLQQTNNTTAPAIPNLSWIQSQYPKVWDGLCRLVQADKHALQAILGAAQTMKYCVEFSPEKATLQKSEIRHRQGNIINILLAGSAQALEDEQDKVRNTERHALTEFYGHLPQELAYEADMLLLQTKLKEISAQVRDSAIAETINEGATLLAPFAEKNISDWRLMRRIDRIFSYQHWPRFFAALATARNTLSAETLSFIAQGCIRAAGLLLQRANSTAEEINALEESSGKSFLYRPISTFFGRDTIEKRVAVGDGINRERYKCAHGLLTFANTCSADTLSEQNAARLHRINNTYIQAVLGTQSPFNKNKKRNLHAQTCPEPWQTDFRRWQFAPKAKYWSNLALIDADFSDAHFIGTLSAPGCTLDNVCFARAFFSKAIFDLCTIRKKLDFSGATGGKLRCNAMRGEAKVSLCGAKIKKIVLGMISQQSGVHYFCDLSDAESDEVQVDFSTGGFEARNLHANNVVIRGEWDIRSLEIQNSDIQSLTCSGADRARVIRITNSSIGTTKIVKISDIHSLDIDHGIFSQVNVQCGKIFAFNMNQTTFKDFGISAEQGMSPSDKRYQYPMVVRGSRGGNFIVACNGRPALVMTENNIDVMEFNTPDVDAQIHGGTYGQYKHPMRNGNSLQRNYDIRDARFGSCDLWLHGQSTINISGIDTNVLRLQGKNHDGNHTLDLGRSRCDILHLKRIKLDAAKLHHVSGNQLMSEDLVASPEIDDVQFGSVEAK